jgi:predicted DNA-binding protein
MSVKQQRINALWHELHDKNPAELESVLLARFARKHKISVRQAYRYLQQARQLETPEAPVDHRGPKQVFSVRLSNNMLERLQATSEVIGQPMSVIIEYALDSALRGIAQGIIDRADEQLKALEQKRRSTP